MERLGYVVVHDCMVKPLIYVGIDVAIKDAEALDAEDGPIRICELRVVRKREEKVVWKRPGKEGK